jgi:hypothetical protein
MIRFQSWSRDPELMVPATWPVLLNVKTVPFEARSAQTMPVLYDGNPESWKWPEKLYEPPA